MPMLETTEIPSPDQLSDTQYLIFYASRNENGMMWCPVRLAVYVSTRAIADKIAYYA
jgi:hypothetical protein